MSGSSKLKISFSKHNYSEDLTFPFGPSRTISQTSLRIKEGIDEVSSHKCFGGFQNVYSHYSRELKSKMQFAVYLPPQIQKGEKVPVIYWLSGFLCNEQNFVQRSGMQRFASKDGIMFVCPDTSPRDFSEALVDSCVVNQGAAFYLDATTEQWKNNFRMYTYVVEELPAVINNKFPVIEGKQSIMGRCMGGHGALICALRNPGKYVAVSALSPICHPCKTVLGKQVYTELLGPDQSNWKGYDSTYLVTKYQGPPMEIFIDYCTPQTIEEEDHYRVNEFIAACAKAKMSLTAQLQKGYDSGYYFVSTFIGKHVRYHARCLKGEQLEEPKDEGEETDELGRKGTKYKVSVNYLNSHLQ